MFNVSKFVQHDQMIILAKYFLIPWIFYLWCHLWHHFGYFSNFSTSSLFRAISLDFYEMFIISKLFNKTRGKFLQNTILIPFFVFSYDIICEVILLYFHFLQLLRLTWVLQNVWDRWSCLKWLGHYFVKIRFWYYSRTS